MRAVLITCMTVYLVVSGTSVVGSEEGDRAAVEVAFARGDFKLARTLFRKPAEEGDPKAQFFFGRLLLQHADVEGFRWVRASAEAGYIPAQRRIAFFRITGLYMEQDPVDHTRRIMRIAERDTKVDTEFVWDIWDARYWLSEAHREGFGTPRDVAKANTLLREAAEAGHEVAQFAYGEILEQGVGVRRDLVEAHKYFVLSWKQGYSINVQGGPQNSPKRRALVVRKRLTPDQLRRSKEGIRAWLAKKDAGQLGEAYSKKPKTHLGLSNLSLDEAEEVSAIGMARWIHGSGSCAAVWLRSRKALRGSPDDERWTERWIFDTCGRRREYHVEMSRYPDRTIHMDFGAEIDERAGE